MKAKTWKKHICEDMEKAGTYNPAFNITINMLADLLELRDAAARQWIESGGAITTERTNRSHETSTYKSPYISTLENLTKTALLYARELGLTSKSLQIMGGEGVSKGKNAGLVDLLNDLTEDAEADMSGAEPDHTS